MQRELGVFMNLNEAYKFVLLVVFMCIIAELCSDLCRFA